MKYYTLLLFFSLTTALQAKDFSSQAEDFCELYSPSTWSHLTESAELYSIYNTILSKYEKMEFSPAMDAIVLGAESMTYAQYYDKVVSEISQHLGKPWSCDDFEDFYSPKQTIISLSLNAAHQSRLDPDDPHNVLLSITEQGAVLINNAELRSATPENIEKAIRFKLKPYDIKYMHVYLYHDPAAPLGKLYPVLSAIQKAGFEQVGLIKSRP